MDDCFEHYSFLKNRTDEDRSTACKTFIHVNRIRPNVSEVHFFLEQCCSHLVHHSLTSKSFHQLHKKACAFFSMTKSYNNQTIDNGCNDNNQFVYFGHIGVHSMYMYMIAVIMAPIGLLANILILSALQKAKRCRNSSTLLYLKNLAIADLLTIIEFILFLVAYSDENFLSYRAKKFLFSSFDIFVGSASLTHITAISLDRAFAVLYPIRHLSSATKSKAKRNVRFLWVLSSLLFLLSVFRIWIKSVAYEECVFYTAVIITFFVPCFLVITAYAAIIITVLKTDYHFNRSNIRTCTVQSTRYREIKLAFNVTIIIIPFVVGWGYFMILNVYEVVNNVRFTRLVDWFMVVLPFMVSCINPVIYILFTSSLRKCSLRILRKWWTCKVFKASGILKSNFRSSRGENSKETTLYRDENETGADNENEARNIAFVQMVTVL